MAKASSGLTSKQQRFVDAYIGAANCNATAAAIAAGYPRRSARSVGHENLTKPDIQAAIKARFAAAAMAADEVLGRLAQQARNEASRFFQVRDGGLSVDLEALQEAGLMHLVKGVKRTKYGQVIEFYDAQAALALIGRHLRLFTDRTELGGDPENPAVVKVLRGVSMDEL